MSKYDIYHNRITDEYRAVSFDKERIVYRIGFILFVLVSIIGICTELPSLPLYLNRLLSFEFYDLLRLLGVTFMMLWLIPTMYKHSGFKEELSLKKQGYKKIGTIEASSENEAVNMYLEKCGKVE